MTGEGLWECWAPPRRHGFGPMRCGGVERETDAGWLLNDVLVPLWGQGACRLGCTEEQE